MGLSLFTRLTLHNDHLRLNKLLDCSTQFELGIIHNNAFSDSIQYSIQTHILQVETIGDAYMVVCGVPEYCADHAEKVVDFALDAVVAANLVKAPATGSSIQVCQTTNRY